MIKVADIILASRSRLGDIDYKNLRFSDAEIIDAINSALAHLSEELLCFAKIWVIPCKDGVNRYELPDDYLRLISVNFNGEIITKERIISLEKRKNSNFFLHSKVGVGLDMQTIHIFNTKIKSSDEIEIYYNYYETIDNKDDDIKFPLIGKEAIVYFVLSLLYQSPVRVNGLDRANYYRSLYEIELKKLRSRVNKDRQSRFILSDYIRV